MTESEIEDFLREFARVAAEKQRVYEEGRRFRALLIGRPLPVDGGYGGRGTKLD